MSRSKLFVVALAGVAAALSGGAASAGIYYYPERGPAHYGPYAPYQYNPYPQPYYYAPNTAPYYGPHTAPNPYAPPPRPPLINWREGAKYYTGAGNGVSACYQQNVRVQDARGGWVWAIKTACD